MNDCSLVPSLTKPIKTTKQTNNIYNLNVYCWRFAFGSWSPVCERCFGRTDRNVFVGQPISADEPGSCLRLPLGRRRAALTLVTPLLCWIKVSYRQLIVTCIQRWCRAQPLCFAGCVYLCVCGWTRCFIVYIRPAALPLVNTWSDTAHANHGLATCGSSWKQSIGHILPGSHCFSSGCGSRV